MIAAISEPVPPRVAQKLQRQMDPSGGTRRNEGAACLSNVASANSRLIASERARQ
jgi:hypothetical protein